MQLEETEADEEEKEEGKWEGKVDIYTVLGGRLVGVSKSEWFGIE